MESDFANWIYDCDLIIFKKKDLTSNILIPHQLTPEDIFQNRIPKPKSPHIYFTNGLKIESGDTGAAVFCSNSEATYRFKLDNRSTVFETEARAILVALELIKSKSIINSRIVFDSLSVLNCVRSYNKKGNKHILIYKIIKSYLEPMSLGNKIKLVWVPSHIGIYWNEKADVSARCAVESNDTPDIKTVFTDDFIKSIRIDCLNKAI